GPGAQAEQWGLEHVWSRRVSSRRGAGAPVYVYIMALQALQQFFQQPYSPPVTLGLIALMAGVHFRPAGFLEDSLPYVSEICMNPALVVQERNWRRLLLSVLFHADDAHLIFNMVSLLWKGVHLERRLGSPRFAALVAAFALLSQSLHVAAARLLSDVLAVHTPFYRECSVGFSGVLFALKTVMNADSPAYSSVYGFVLPTKYAAWAELLLIQLLVPEASFLGHLCGILSGLIYLHGPSLLPRSARASAILSTLAAPLLTLFPFLCSSRGRTWGSGQSGQAARGGTGGGGRTGGRDVGRGMVDEYGRDTAPSAPTFPEVEDEEGRSGVAQQQSQQPHMQQGHVSSAEELRALRLQRFAR
ncbi:unnamed protein product, partial [Closterium sp. Naga37s-1]